MSIADKISRLNAAKTDIADAIVAKGGSVAVGDGYEEFADDIATIPSRGTYQNKQVSYTSNGTRTISPDSGFDALSQVEVEVSVSCPSPLLQIKAVTPTAAGFNVTPDVGYDGLSRVTVNGSENLVSANIKKDVTIFGVTGTYEGGGTGLGGTSYNEEKNTYGTTANIMRTDGGYGMSYSEETELEGTEVVISSTGGELGRQAGSLIVASLPASATRAVAAYGGLMISGTIVNRTAYFNIPYPFSGTVTVHAYISSQEISTSEVDIAEIDKYIVNLR